jgi:alkanesulfonate monooxygenase SsuD/methylene tetrahydromethanopterin reductase-like flavin-dependent oxidoreductase (luciferase family)
MKYGVILPRGDARTAADLASEAEQHGWDGFFVWEPVWGVDAWVSLAAAAMRTERIKLGTLLSPVARMRPWKLASEAATLDNLSNGRVIISVGLGATDTDWAAFGEPLGGSLDRKVRAEMMDESLDIMLGLWRGQPFSYQGKHYRVQPSTFMLPAPPVQHRNGAPHIPIWMVGMYGSEKSMRRAVRYDGLLPTRKDAFTASAREWLETVHEATVWVKANRTDASPYDIIVEGNTPGDNPTEAVRIVRAQADAGATWWIEANWEAVDAVEKVFERVRQGPPGV